MKNRDLYTLSFYREKRGGEIGPQLETMQVFSNTDRNAIKTAKIIAEQASWRLLQVRVSTRNEKIILE